MPLNHIREGQAEFEVIDTLLSEEAVLGFEYGYSTAEPKALVLWEAQFGDFANGAQVVIDQFIASGEMKWLRMCGLVMLLPHGYEGQGPEHSSARLERYLQLCAQDNMQVAYCTTPANYFHILRRQMHRQFRKPLILMTPKSLLRHKRAVSFLSDMGPGSSFHRVFHDQAECVPGATSVKLVPDEADQARHHLHRQSLFRSDGRAREARAGPHHDLRLEQLYPFPEAALAQELRRFPKAEIIWCQEEPKNQGAWTFVEPRIEDTDRQTRRQRAPALCRPPRICLHRRRPREPARRGIESIPERGAHIVMPPSAHPTFTSPSRGGRRAPAVGWGAAATNSFFCAHPARNPHPFPLRGTTCGNVVMSERGRQRG